MDELEAALHVPPIPSALEYLWAAYHRIRRRKAWGFNGPAPIEWPDIDAFVRHSRNPLAPWEVALIEDIDDLYLAECAKTKD
ncbi:phage tail assembly chaperone [Jiella avicenniae]|uniref:phage tail assembly chaperone n=1 Tax=Jiella avicenniae TaxID=2907202 RepID=UPI003B8453C4